MFSKYPMIPVDSAKSIIRSSLPDHYSEEISILQSKNRVLSQDLHSPINFPPFRASTMDGYAINHTETPGNFQIFSATRAGDIPSNLPPGYCSYITTGAAIPDHADAVIPIEDVKINPDSIEIPKCSANQFIRSIGSDIKQGELVGQKSTVLTPSHIALLASIGFTTVPVNRLPVIGIISTGSELKEIGQSLNYGEIIDSNRLMIKMLLEEAQVQVKDYGIVKDSYEEIRENLLRMSQECDFWISSGGVSMGDKDFVKPLIEQEGEVLFGRVNMKPGKPMTFGKIGKCLAFALPGNPVSCFVCFYLFVRYAIDCVLGRHGLSEVRVRLMDRVKLDPRPEYHRALVKWKEGGFVAVSTGPQQSSRLLSTVQANAILVFPAVSDSKKEISGEVQAILLNNFESLPPAPKPQHYDLSKTIAQVGILTISDRAYNKIYEDKSGPLLQVKVKELWDTEISYKIVPDEHSNIKEALLLFCESCDVIFTTGGTGFGQRDRTPEVTKEVIEKEAPGLVMKMISDGMKSTEFACLSRQIAGSRGKTLIINLPGSLGGVTDCFNSVCELVPHIVYLLKEG